MTDPALRSWPGSDRSFRRADISVVIGRGDDVWARARHEVLRWTVKTRSGFAVDSTGPVTEGERVTVTARVLWMTIVEPVEVAVVVDRPDRAGFAYRTLPGHPVSGEEAFIVHRDGDEVRLTVRSLTRASPGRPWRALFPLLIVAQRVVRRRYLRSLR